MSHFEWAMDADVYDDYGNDDLVTPANACPQCGERRLDSLEWLDYEHLGCATCDHVYVPGDPDAENVSQE